MCILNQKGYREHQQPQGLVWANYGCVTGSITVVGDNYLDWSIAYVRALREVIKAGRPVYLSPYEAALPF